MHLFFQHVKKQKVIFNKCEQNNMIGEILNADENVDDQEDFGFTGSYLKIAPTYIVRTVV